MKIALSIAYDGTSYFGSQIQKETKNTIFTQMQNVFNSLGFKDKFIASGRTEVFMQLLKLQI